VSVVSSTGNQPLIGEGHSLLDPNRTKVDCVNGHSQYQQPKNQERFAIHLILLGKDLGKSPDATKLYSGNLRFRLSTRRCAKKTDENSVFPPPMWLATYEMVLIGSLRSVESKKQALRSVPCSLSQGSVFRTTYCGLDNVRPETFELVQAESLVMHEYVDSSTMTYDIDRHCIQDLTMLEPPPSQTRLNTFEKSVLFLAFIGLVWASAWSAFHSAPTFDEGAHVASGLLLASKGDPGFFKVNPPVNKWFTAFSSYPFDPFHCPDVIASCDYSPSIRPEFDLGDEVLRGNFDRYLNLLRTARSMRIGMLLLGAFFLWLATEFLPPANRVLTIVFWCSSPLILGHGWVVAADALVPQIASLVTDGRSVLLAFAVKTGSALKGRSSA
jgi:hypothetical protein